MGETLDAVLMIVLPIYSNISKSIAYVIAKYHSWLNSCVGKILGTLISREE